MSAGNLRFVGSSDEGFGIDAHPDQASEPPPEPKVFVRTLSAPPGWPWEQSRSAELEARHGAPLPIAELHYRLRRLDSWRPGAATRFAAFYVLTSDVKGRLEASALVDGRQLSVTFLGGGEGQTEVGKVALRASVAAGLAFVAFLSISAALSKRAETTAELDLAEKRLAPRLKHLEARVTDEERVRLLENEAYGAVRLREVVADLAWVSNAKLPEARIEALHWEPGLMAIEAKGTLSPLAPAADHTVERSRAPVRKGVWLWGVSRKPSMTSPPAQAEGGEGGR